MQAPLAPCFTYMSRHKTSLEFSRWDTCDAVPAESHLLEHHRSVPRLPEILTCGRSRTVSTDQHRFKFSWDSTSVLPLDITSECSRGQNVLNGSITTIWAISHAWHPYEGHTLAHFCHVRSNLVLLGTSRPQGMIVSRKASLRFAADTANLRRKPREYAKNTLERASCKLPCIRVAKHIRLGCTCRSVPMSALGSLLPTHDE
jgi:hypothetical protein